MKFTALLPDPSAPSPWLFADAARVAALRAAVPPWLGTPFRENSAVPGPLGGVDCVRLVLALHAAAGTLPARALPAAPLDYSLHQRASLVEAFLEGRVDDPASRAVAAVAERLPEAAEDEAVALLAGDVVTIRIHHCAHHAGVVLDPDPGVLSFVHVLCGYEAMVGTLRDPSLGARASRVYRARAAWVEGGAS